MMKPIAISKLRYIILYTIFCYFSPLVYNNHKIKFRFRVANLIYLFFFILLVFRWGYMWELANRHLLIFHRIIRKKMFVGKLRGEGRKGGIPMQDVGGGGGEDGRIHRDRRVRERVWGRSELGRYLVGFLAWATIHRQDLLPMLLPKLPQHCWSLLQLGRGRR